MDEFEKMNRIGEGTYGVVCRNNHSCTHTPPAVASLDEAFPTRVLVICIDRARDTRSKEIVALKRVRMERERDGEGN